MRKDTITDRLRNAIDYVYDHALAFGIGAGVLGFLLALGEQFEAAVAFWIIATLLILSQDKDDDTDFRGGI